MVTYNLLHLITHKIDISFLNNIYFLDKELRTVQPFKHRRQ